MIQKAKKLNTFFSQIIFLCYISNKIDKLNDTFTFASLKWSEVQFIFMSEIIRDIVVSKHISQRHEELSFHLEIRK